MLRSKKDFVSFTGILILGLAFGYYLHKPAVKVETRVEAVQVEVPFVAKIAAKPENTFICHEYQRENKTIKEVSSCRPYMGEVVVDGTKYYKTQYYDDEALDLVKADSYSKLFYVKEVTVR